jgi:putative spermidine/putrescine transport system substrate-binding protein
MRHRKIAAALTSVVLLVGACSSGGASTAPSAAPSAAAPSAAAPSAAVPSTAASAATSAAPSIGPAALGPGEGRLDLAAWGYYVVGGTGGEKVAGAPDWVTPFEQQTGCKVYVKVYGGSSDAVALMKTGEYDGGAFSGDATLRMIASGDVAAVNTALIPNYANVFEGLKGKSHNTVNGVPYGVPHGRGANVLMWRTDIVQPDPDSWSVVWEGGSKYAGKVTAYDYEIYIADAAVYLMATNPTLGIKDPYALDEAQFAAAVNLLKEQRKNITTYWSAIGAQVDAFTKGDMVVGTTWQVTANTLTGAKVPIKSTLPKEGSTGWSDTWMIASKAKHPNCMYMWMDYIISPVANATATVYYGEAPVSPQGCAEAEKQSPGHCDAFHATDEEYWKKIYLWNTPSKECLDGRGPICTDFSEWTKAWTEVKG